MRILALFIVTVLGVFAGAAVVEAASSPSLLTFHIDHQTLCRREVRELPISIGNPTNEPMVVHVDAITSFGQPELDGSALVSFDAADFVMPPQSGRIIDVTLTIPKTARQGDYATLLRFTNVTDDFVRAAVGVWLRFEVSPWHINTPKCGD